LAAAERKKERAKQKINLNANRRRGQQNLSWIF
jgi:hypothetical protein